jgi:hypothetical protein
VAGAFGAAGAGRLFMVGAFLAGAMMETKCLAQAPTDQLPHRLLLVAMPMLIRGAGLRTHWRVDGAAADGRRSTMPMVSP